MRMHRRTNSERLISWCRVSFAILRSSSGDTLNVNEMGSAMLHTRLYSGQFQRLKAAKRSPKIITTTPKYRNASGMAQNPKPLNVNQHAQPKKNPARNSGNAASCGLLVLYRPQAATNDMEVAAKKIMANSPCGHELGIRRLRGGGVHSKCQGGFSSEECPESAHKAGQTRQIHFYRGNG